MIPADRVETNVELSQILADLFPLLRAVRPADLNATLNALSTALEGRGEQLGADDGRARRLPRRDRRPPARRCARTWWSSPTSPTPTTSPRPTCSTPSQRHRDQPDHHREAPGSSTCSSPTSGGLAETSTRILRENEQNLIRVGRVTEPVLALLAAYSPEFPCLLKGAASYAPILTKTFEGDWVKQYIEFGNAQYAASTSATRRSTARSDTARGASACRTSRSPGARSRWTRAATSTRTPRRSIVPNFGALPGHRPDQRLRRERGRPGGRQRAARPRSRQAAGGVRRARARCSTDRSCGGRAREARRMTPHRQPQRGLRRRRHQARHLHAWSRC